MKKLIYIVAIFALHFLSCSDEIDSQINGFWQLKTIENNGVVNHVDTVFYGFQRGATFSISVLLPDNSLVESIYSYGYVSFPSENKMKISMDTARYEDGSFKVIRGDFLKYSEWGDYYITFDVKQLDNKHLIVSKDEKIFSFSRH